MAAPAVIRALFTNRTHFKHFVFESTRNLSVERIVVTQSFQCLKCESLGRTTTPGSRSTRSGLLEKIRLVKCKHQNTDGTRWTSALLGAVAAFSLFRSAEEDSRDEGQKKEDEIILLLKKAKLSMYRGQLQAASGFLHQAVALAHRTSNTQAIIYTYSLMANLAYFQGQLDKAEKLFKAAMSYMLSGGTPEDDNAIIEISLKLATIYAGQSKTELAEHGYRFCTESLEAKLERHRTSLMEDQSSTSPEEDQSGTSPAEDQSEELRKETRLLLGLCLDSRARYRAATRRLQQATQDYRLALQICHEEQGESHPQTLVLMSDLATILDLQGLHDEALPLVKRAVDLSREAGHPDQHVLLANMAGVLLHQGDVPAAVRLYKEAMSLAQAAGDEEGVQQIQEGLEEVQKKKKDQREQKKKEEDGEAAGQQ